MAKLLLAFLALVTIQSAYSELSFRWCARPADKAKCTDFVKYVKETAKNKSLTVSASCVDGKDYDYYSDYDDCATKIKNNEADLVTLDGGYVYTAGKTYGLVPIVSEQYGKYGVKYFGVAIVKKANTGFNLKTLKGKKSCHTGYRRTAGWNVPIGYLLRSKIMPLEECDIISAANYFNQSCVPGVRAENDSEEVNDKLCALCAGTGADKCSGDSKKNKYAGYHGAFKCMADGKGDVAFAKYTTTEEVVKLGNHGNVSDYQYLCKDGSRKEIGQHESCNLGFNPGHAVVTRNDYPGIEAVITILTAMSHMYGVNQTDPSKFQLFNSTKYNGDNLLFKDSTTELKAIPSGKRTYKGFLGNDYVLDTEALKSCETPTTQTTKPVPTSLSTKTAPYTMLVLVLALLTVLLL